MQQLACVHRFRRVVIGTLLLASVTLAYSQSPVSDDNAGKKADAAAATPKTGTAPATPSTAVTVEPAGPAATSETAPAANATGPANPGGNNAAGAPANAAAATPNPTTPDAVRAVAGPALPPAPTPQPLPANAPAVTTASTGYLSCLGCPEHEELKNRWERPWKYTVLAHALIAAGGIALEAHGKSLGLCERDPLMRSSVSYNGCHPFSMKRTLLVAMPVEVLAFTSPSWGLSKYGHPRIGTSLELIPILLHLRAAIRTTHSINRLQAMQGR